MNVYVRKMREAKWEKRNERSAVVIEKINAECENAQCGG
jgi:hypothetical protein